jgi:GT2 family glycosyltransferase
VRNTHYPYQLIIIDNGSETETQGYLRELSRDNKLRITLIRNEANLGYIKAVNQGLSIADADYVCLFNNDVMVGEGWLGEMINIANSDTKIGIVNPDSDEECSNSENELLKYGTNNRLACRGQFIEIMGAMGFCMLIKKELITKVGFLDEVFGLGGYDDMDYSRRVWQAGYKCVKAQGAYVIHRVHSSFDSLGKKKKRQIGRQARTLFWRKWDRIPRVAIIVSKSFEDKDYFNKLYSQAHNLARQWNTVHLLLKESADFFKPQHQSITLMKYPDKLFLFRCLGEILKPRKKGLRFKTVFVDSASFAQLLRLFNLIHRARVILI